MMPHESWLATELLLFAFFVALLVIAAMCAGNERQDGGKGE